MWWWLLVACGTSDTDRQDDPEPDTALVTDTGTPPDTGTPGDTDTDTVPLCPDDLQGPLAQTTTGCIQGREEQGVEAFLGVPYAEPPVDALRWARPVPIAPWTEPLAAVEPGQVCLQTNGTVDLDLLPGEGGEDCLFLNVLRPEGTQPGDELPVLFFIHGGGHSDGAGSQTFYLGSSLSQPMSDPPLSPEVTALAGNAVVVTINYRLAQLGWIALPGLSDEDADGVSGNQGLWDALEALQWTHDNVRAFGGDPDQLTVFGESAGSVMTCALLASPEAAGLFGSAILQSGICTAYDHRIDVPSATAESGYQQAQRLVEGTGCAGGSPAEELACLRALPVEQVMEVMPARLGFIGDGEGYTPVVDGVLLPEPPLTLFSRGDFNRVPVVMGVNEDEGTLFTALAPMTSEVVLTLTLRGVADIKGWDEQELVDLYDPAAYGGDVHAAWTAFVTDSSFICAARQTSDVLVDHVDVRAYLFTRDSWALPELGASHGFELPFVFGTGVFPGADQDLSDRMVAAWTTVPTGSPTISPIGDWPGYGHSTDGNGGTWVRLDHTTEPVHGVRQTQCDWFREQGYLVP